MNKIVIELCDEDRKRLDAISAGLGFLAGLLVKNEGKLQASAPVADEHPVEASTSHFDPPEDPLTTLPDEVPPAKDPAPAPVPLAELQKALVERCAVSADDRMKVQALVHEYAESVSAIPEEKRAEVLEKLGKI